MCVCMYMLLKGGNDNKFKENECRCKNEDDGTVNKEIEVLKM